MKELIRLALKEDLGSRGDITTKMFVPKTTRLKGFIVAKQDGVVCGTKVAERVFKAVDRGIEVRVLKKDGSRVRKGDKVLSVAGGPSILAAERTALNFMQRMSGVATLTARYCALLSGTRARVFDTRKTLPGWRALDKYAVLCGGGRNHRMGLHDAVLLKDNHWAAGGDVAADVKRARKRYPGVVVELEAADLAQVEKAVAAGADVVLLDNMPPPLLRRAIGYIRRKAPRVQIEVSGNVTLETLPALGRLGPDRISVGRITHSAPALDLSLEIGT